MTRDLSDLRQIADLKFRQSEQKLAAVQAREAKLRGEMARLQALARETHSQPASDAELRAIGGDIIWLKWLASSQRRLSIELAQVLAQKEHLMTDHRRESGKKSVADTLHARSLAHARSEQNKKRLETTIERTQLRSHLLDQ